VRLGQAQTVLADLATGEPGVDRSARSLVVPVSGGAAALAEALRRLAEAGVALEDVGLRRPTLDEVFLTLTGHASEETEKNRETDTTKTTREARA
jgi:ABC-2 type transport system ATP-binding protein